MRIAQWFLLVLALGAAGLLMRRAAMDGYGTQGVMTGMPPELTEHQLGAGDGGRICASSCGTCRCEWKTPSDLPWQTTPKDIDNWTGNPWGIK